LALPLEELPLRRELGEAIGTEYLLDRQLVIRSVTDLSQHGAWKTEGWSEGDGQALDGKATHEDEPATLDP
jgi:hypothetical protein